MPPPLTLNPALDIAPLRALFARAGRLQIVNWLAPDGVRALHEALAASAGWRLTFNHGERVIDYRPEAWAGLDAAERTAIDRAVIAGARRGFQFRYDTIRDDGPVGPLTRFAAFLNAPATLDFLRSVTGAEDVTRGDAHASRYRPGHFLGSHDDAIAGRGRRAAYVLNLTPRWHPDWGGQLLFYDAQGQVTRGFTPGFNILNLFAVPQPHGVSYVTPFAAGPRLAITGWLLGDETGGDSAGAGR